MDFNKEFLNDIDFVNKNLEKYLPTPNVNQDEVVDAMRYSLTIGGKRLRPIFCIRFAEMFGVSRDDSIAFATAVEFIHTYSLIHDDLPCMDNDDLRRGKPSCHKQFSEDTALLAGDALLTHAFLNITNSKFSSEQKVKAVTILGEKAGVCGMIGGQVIDLKYESQKPSLNQIIDVHNLKTAALIECACVLGCIAGNASDEEIQSATTFANNLGLAFQIQDDILDIVGDEKKLGKPIGSDADNEKTTYVNIVGIDKAKEDVKEYTNRAIKALNSFKNNEYLIELSKFLVNREY